MRDRPWSCVFLCSGFFVVVVGMPLLILGQGCLMSAEVKGYVKEGK